MTKEKIYQPLIGFSVIERIVKESDDKEDDNKLMKELGNTSIDCHSKNMPALVNFIRSHTWDELCEMIITRDANIIPSGQTIWVPCRGNTGPIKRKTPVLSEPNELVQWPPRLEIHEGLMFHTMTSCFLAEGT